MIRIVVELRDADGQVYALATATAENVSDLALYSVYAVTASEHFNAVAGRQGWASKGMIGRHDRRQSVWALVERIAAWAKARAEDQGRPGMTMDCLRSTIIALRSLAAGDAPACRSRQRERDAARMAKPFTDPADQATPS